MGFDAVRLRAFSVVRILVCFFLVLTGSMSYAQDKTERIIAVRGVGSVFVPPDQARIDLGVITRESAAEQAQKENAEAIKKVLYVLEEMGIHSPQVRTSSFAIRQGYQGKKRRFVAENTIKLTLDDISRVGSVIDAAVDAGANQVHLRFVQKDDARGVRALALEKAVEDAKYKAQQLAKAAGVKIGEIVYLREKGVNLGSFRGDRNIYYIRAVEERGDMEGPFVPGENEVRAQVEVAFRIQ